MSSRSIAMRIALIFCGILTACSPVLPAPAPPQLTHTPSAYIEISRGRFKARGFQFKYPPSWRLIKLSAAADDLHIILRPPKGGELSIRVVGGPDDSEALFIPLTTGNFLMLAVDAPSADTADMAAEIERIIRSIRS